MTTILILAGMISDLKKWTESNSKGAVYNILHIVIFFALQVTKFTQCHNNSFASHYDMVSLPRLLLIQDNEYSLIRCAALSHPKCILTHSALAS